jgi:hypothetical protein
MIHSFRLFGSLITRNVLAGLVLGLLCGGAFGCLFPFLLAVAMWIGSLFYGAPSPPTNDWLFFIFGAFVGGGLGLIAGAFYGLLLGCINGLAMSLITRFWFVPLTDTNQYERVMRRCTSIVTAVGTICSIGLMFWNMFMLILGIVPALLFGLIAGRVSNRLIRPYLAQARPVEP